MSASGRYCCKSLFALVIKNSPGCRRDFRVKMWGTSSPDDKLTGDLGNAIETTQIGGRRSDRLTAGKLSPGNFGLLQQYRHHSDEPIIARYVRSLGWSGLSTDASWAVHDPLPPSAIQSSCVAVFLFDQLVRAQQDRCRHIEAKRLGGLHIEHGLVFRSNFARSSAAISLAKA
jgi:hypothetical protein